MDGETKYWRDPPAGDPIVEAIHRRARWPLYRICVNQTRIGKAIAAGFLPPGTGLVLIDESDLPGGEPPCEHHGYLWYKHLRNGPMNRYAIVPDRSGVWPDMRAYIMPRPPGGWRHKPYPARWRVLVRAACPSRWISRLWWGFPEDVLDEPRAIRGGQ